MDYERSPSDYRTVLISNPNSTRAGRLWQDVAEPLRGSAWGAPVELPTAHCSADDNAEQLAGHIRAGDLLLAGGGDGLAHSVANALRLRPELASQAWMVPLPAGNACDISRSIYGRDILSAGGLLPALRRGPARPVDVVGVDTNAAGRWGMAYASIGLTASLAAMYGDEVYRKGRPRNRWAADAYDIVMTYRQLRASRPFAMAGVAAGSAAMVAGPEGFAEAGGDGADEGVLQLRHEILCLNMPRLAKFGRVAVSAWEGSAILEFPARHFGRDAAWAAGQLVSPRGLRGDVLTERRFVIGGTDGGEVPVQVDGEVDYLQTGDAISFKRRPGALWVIGPDQQ